MQQRVIKIIDNLLPEEYLVAIAFDSTVNMMGSKNGVVKIQDKCLLTTEITI